MKIRLHFTHGDPVEADVEGDDFSAVCDRFDEAYMRDMPMRVSGAWIAIGHLVRVEVVT